MSFRVFLLCQIWSNFPQTEVSISVNEPTHHFLFFADASKTDVPEDFDIDMDDPETEKAAVAIQSQFRKFQKKKRVEKS
uniref:Purkinje cell protein 4 n=1 Tax=Sphaeramia orbicularis TaxID=375764 RepID=A0A673CLK2_9TELE